MHYKRYLGYFHSSMIVLGGTIGVGIFVNPTVVAERLMTSTEFMLVWLAGGIFALIGSLCYAELGTRIPRAGGNYVYLLKAFGPLPAFLFGWTMLLVISPGIGAVIAVVLGRHIVSLFQLPVGWTTSIAVSSILLVSLVNYFGIKAGALLMSFLNVLKISLLGIIVLLGFLYFQEPSFPSVSAGQPVSDIAGNLARLMTALVPVLFTCNGWQNLSYLGSEIRNPQKNLPRALLTGILLMAGFYLAFNYLLVHSLSISGLQQTATPAAELGEKIFGILGRTVVSIGVILSALGFLSVVLMAQPRIYCSMAKDGLFFRNLSKLHPVYKTPGLAILFQAILTTVLAITGTYSQLLDYSVFGNWSFGLLTVATLFVLRKKQVEGTQKSIFLTPGYPWLPIVFILASLTVVLGAMISSPWPTFWGAVLIISGIPVFYFFRSRY